MTDQPASLAEALAELQKDLPHIAKDADAQYGKYADLAGITRQIMPKLGELGLSFTARPTLTDRGFVLAYELRHVADEVGIGGEYPLPGMEKGPQALGSAITYARRYTLCAVTGVAPDEDDDDAAAAEQAPKEKPQRTRTKIPGADHERLQPRRQPGDRPAERGPIPADQDLWQDQPPGSFQPYEPEKAPGSIDGRQRSLVFARLTELSTEPGEQRRILSSALGREVTSRKDVGALSQLEGARVLEDLDGRVKAKRAAEEAARIAAEQDAAAEVAAP